MKTTNRIASRTSGPAEHTFAIAPYCRKRPAPTPATVVVPTPAQDVETLREIVAAEEARESQRLADAIDYTPEDEIAAGRKAMSTHDTGRSNFVTLLRVVSFTLLHGFQWLSGLIALLTLEMMAVEHGLADCATVLAVLLFGWMTGGALMTIAMIHDHACGDDD